MTFLTCFYIELASIKFVLSSVHRNNYKTKDRLINSLIVFDNFLLHIYFGVWSQESGFFKESGVGVAFQNCKESGVGVALKITDSPSLRAKTEIWKPGNNNYLAMGRRVETRRAAG